MSEGREFSLFFGEWRVPLDLTLLAVDDKGVTVGTPHPDFSFHFRYRNINYSVRFRDVQGEASIEVAASLGRFPFTAESAVQRQALSAIVRAANQHLGPVLSIGGGRIALKNRLVLAMPVTAVGLVSTLCRFLLPLKPYLDLMDLIRTMPAAARA